MGHSSSASVGSHPSPDPKGLLRYPLVHLVSGGKTSGSVRIVRICFLDVTTILSLLSVVQCISVLSGAGIGCMIESVTIRWVTGSSKLKNNGQTTKT